MLQIAPRFEPPQLGESRPSFFQSKAGHLGLNKLLLDRTALSRLSCSAPGAFPKRVPLFKKEKENGTVAFARGFCCSLFLLCFIHLPFQKSPNRNDSNTPSKLILGKAHKWRKKNFKKIKKFGFWECPEERTYPEIN